MNKKYFILLLFIFSLFFVAPYIKNETRIIEKKINLLNDNIFILNKKLGVSKVEFYFLTSPKQIHANALRNLSNNLESYGIEQINISKEMFIETMNRNVKVKTNEKN